MLLRNSFNGGTVSTTITSGNSGGASGDAFTVVNGSPTFVAETGPGAPLAARIDGGTSDVLGWDNVAVSGREVWVREYATFTSFPSSEDWFFELNYKPPTGSTVMVGQLRIGPTGTLSFRRTGSGSTICSLANAITLNQQVRIELRAKYGTSGPDGAADLWVYRTVESDVVDLYSGAATADLGTSPPNTIGFVYAPGVTRVIDDVAVTDQGKLGPAYGIAASPAPRRFVVPGQAAHRSASW